MNTNSIDISVYILTYNHKNFIEQALNSALSQKTTYSYEIIVSDDCSTDGTQEIIKSYIKRYPNIIKGYFNSKNEGIPKNIYKARCKCSGKYIINLSGDDYWINDKKLQIQGDFLEKNLDYIGVAARTELRKDSETKEIAIFPALDKCNRDITIRDYEKGMVPNCHGLMIRNLFLTKENREYFKQAQNISDKVDDAVDEVLLLRLGKFYTLDVVTDVYRICTNKNESNYNNRYSNYDKMKQNLELVNKLYEKFGKEINFTYRYIQFLWPVYLEALKDTNNKKKYYSLTKNVYKKNGLIKTRAFLKSIIIFIKTKIMVLLGKIKRIIDSFDNKCH